MRRKHTGLWGEGELVPLTVKKFKLGLESYAHYPSHRDAATISV